MNDARTLRRPTPAPLGARLVPAEVRAARGSEIEVMLEGAPVVARLAVVSPIALRAGDEVLLADGDDGARFVIGVLRRLREASVIAETSDGATVRLEDDAAAGQVLTIAGPDGEVWFEHRAGEARSVLRAPHGTLQIHADAGDLELSAARRVTIRAEHGVIVDSPEEVRFSAGDSAHFALTPRLVELVGAELRGRLERARLEIEGDAGVTARVLETTADVVRTAARVVETTADRTLERARESYREVSELAQVRAGQLRLVAEKTFRVLAERTHLKARKDMKLRGETIYLD